MKALDLCCCSGGASDGYREAGFELVGVDIKPQPHYPYEFHLGSALDVLDGKGSVNLADFDFIHASPPCQTHTSLIHIRNAQSGKSRVIDILDEVVDRLVKLGKPFIVENVDRAKLASHTHLHCVTLCGSMFGLKVRRHRKFWSNIPLTAPKCNHKAQGRPIGVYGRKGDHVKGVWKGKVVYGGVTAKTDAEAVEAMGFARAVPWAKLKEAIPPAYSKHLGFQVRAYLEKNKK